MKLCYLNDLWAHGGTLCKVRYPESTPISQGLLRKDREGMSRPRIWLIEDGARLKNIGIASGVTVHR
jgi:hypothetical protein